MSRGRERATGGPDDGAASRRMLEELSALGDGDLTVRATVVDGTIGEIADSMNHAVGALRELAVNINITSERLFDTVRNTQDSLSRLDEAGVQLLTKSSQSNAATHEAAVSADQLATNVIECSQLAQRLAEIAEQGEAASRDTTASLDVVRGYLQETAKRLKRSSDSAQQLGEITRVVDDIADRGHLLAINAAIQCARVENGGSSVQTLSDDVERLAEHTGEAAQQVRRLVRLSQSDAQAAVSAMEATTARFVASAKDANQVRESAGELRALSQQISALARKVASATRKQTRRAAEIAASASIVELRTILTRELATGAVRSLEGLAELAGVLRTSVARLRVWRDDVSGKRPASGGKDAGDTQTTAAQERNAS